MNLEERIRQDIRYRARGIKELVDSLKLINQLPQEIQDLEGDVFGYLTFSDKITLMVRFFSFSNPKVDLVNTFKMCGVQGITPKIISDNNWQAEGECALPDGNEAKFYLYGLPNPPNCQIEEYKEEVTKYRAICPESGEEL